MAQQVSHDIHHNSLGSDGLMLKHYDVLQDARLRLARDWRCIRQLEQPS
jgi:hypothetical protein